MSLDQLSSDDNVRPFPQAGSPEYAERSAAGRERREQGERANMDRSTRAVEVMFGPSENAEQAEYDLARMEAVGEGQFEASRAAAHTRNLLMNNVFVVGDFNVFMDERMSGTG